MASIYKVGHVWYLRYQLHGKRYRESTGTSDKAKAVVALKARLGEIAQDRVAKHMGVPTIHETRAKEQRAEAARISLDDFLRDYEDHYKSVDPALKASRTRSWQADEAALKAVFSNFRSQGLHFVNEVEEKHVGAYRDWRSARGGVSGATINKSLRCAKAAWGWAVHKGYARLTDADGKPLLQPNPFKLVKPLRLPKYDPKTIGDVGIRKILDAAKADDPRLFGLVAVAVYGGLRNGELAALEWTDVDLGSATIHVRCDPTFVAKGRSGRSVPMAPELVEILRPLAKRSGLCFPSPESGKRYPAWSLSQAMSRIAAAASVKATLHTLRRSFATMLVKRGVPPARVKEYLGHQSLTTTMTYYVGDVGLEHNDVALLRFGLAQEPKPEPKNESSQAG
jgi:integrase